MQFLRPIARALLAARTMGQTPSSLNEARPASLQRRSRRGFRSEQNTGQAVPDSPPTLSTQQENPGEPRASLSDVSPILSNGVTVRRQISAQSTLALETQAGEDLSSAGQDAVVIEQEERPLMNMRDLQMRSAPITDISASPMPRRPSVLTRLGSRMRPRLHQALSAEPQDIADESTPQPESDAPSPRHDLNGFRPRNRNRFSLLSPLSRFSSLDSPEPHPRRRLTISRPIPLEMNDDFAIDNAPRQTPTPEQVSNADQLHLRSFPQPSQQVSRLTRMRHSLSGTWDTLIRNNAHLRSDAEQPLSAPRRPLRSHTTEDTDYLLPPVQMHEVNLLRRDSQDPSYQPSRASATGNLRSAPSERPLSWTQRLAERSQANRADERRRPNMLRGRSSRLIRRDDETPLSRVLQLAAAAIAAQLSGSTNALANMEALGDDHFDGGLNRFVEELSHATGTPSPATVPNTNLAVTTLPPLNFWRAFRFFNSGNAARNGGNEASQQVPLEEDVNDGRTVTLVVVGVRSVPSASITGDGVIESSLDTLMSLPILPNNASPRNHAGPGLLSGSAHRQRFAHRRGSSLGARGSSTFSSQEVSSRIGVPEANPSSGVSPPNPRMPSINFDSPPGPSQPPSTPADPACLSGINTPNRRPSSASAAQPTPAFQNETLPSHPETESLSTSSSLPMPSEHGVRQRRRSDSEFARHRDLGAGAARRNGVVEPDDVHGQGRSWLIYVVGTNLSEDHPAFATPSLFPDVRIYLVKPLRSDFMEANFVFRILRTKI